MKVVRIRHIFYPDLPQDYFYELTARQARNGNEMHVVTWKKGGGGREILIRDNITIHRLPGIRLVFSSITPEYPYLPGMSEELEEIDPDIIHIESHLFITSIQAMRWATRSGVPTVLSIHGVRTRRTPLVDVAEFLYLRTLGIGLMRSASRVVCLTRSDAEEVAKMKCPPEKIRIVPNAIDADLFSSSSRRRTNLILWTGRFVPEKGVRYLIDAARILEEETDTVEFLLVGYGPSRSEMEYLITELGMSKYCSITGPLTRGEIANLLQVATVFAFPSLREGLPLSLLEAMASGIAIVASDIPGPRDLLAGGQNGILVPPRNPVSLAKAIKSLLSDVALRDRLGQSARRTALEKYNWNTILQSLDSVYKEALSDSLTNTGQLGS